MSFIKEADLVSVLLDGAKERFAGRFDLYAEELSVGSRWIDIAFAQWNRDWEERQLHSFFQYQKSFRRLSMTELRYLSLFVGNEIVSIHQMMDSFLLTSDEVKKRFLGIFLDLDLIRRESRYSYRATEWIHLEPDNIVAVEAKLRNWNEALMQAIYCRSFADYCYVALDGDYWNDDVVRQFKLEGIGLILVFQDGIKVQLEPKRTKRNQYSLEARFQRTRLIRDIVMKRSNKWRSVKAGGA